VTFGFTARGVSPDGVVPYWVVQFAGAIGACTAMLIIGMVRGLPGMQEQAAAEGDALPM
jgi:glycerol uptake facilitator-like aquaporin